MKIYLTSIAIAAILFSWPASAIASETGRTAEQVIQGMHRIYEGYIEWLHFDERQHIVIVFDSIKTDDRNGIVAKGKELYGGLGRFQSVDIDVRIDPASLEIIIIERPPFEINPEDVTYAHTIVASISPDFLRLQTSRSNSDDPFGEPYIVLLAKQPQALSP